jgi:hypothetical protein
MEHRTRKGREEGRWKKKENRFNEKRPLSAFLILKGRGN